MSRYVDPVLVAVSDCLVLTALERAWSRTVPRSARARVPARDKHRGYMLVPIHSDRIDKALEGAWDLCPLLAVRHDLDDDIDDTDQWVSLLDSYTRALIMMVQPHQPQRLAAYLHPLAHPAPGSREFMAVS